MGPTGLVSIQEEEIWTQTWTEKTMQGHREKAAIYKPRREAGNRSFPRDPSEGTNANNMLIPKS